MSKRVMENAGGEGKKTRDPTLSRGKTIPRRRRKDDSIEKRMGLTAKRDIENWGGAMKLKRRGNDGKRAKGSPKFYVGGANMHYYLGLAGQRQANGRNQNLFDLKPITGSDKWGKKKRGGCPPANLRSTCLRKIR